MQGPNVKKLIAHKMSIDAVPANGGFRSAIDFLLDKDRIKRSARDAEEWVQASLLLIRQAAEPNPWKEADDEAIAGELLRQIDERWGQI